MTQHSILFSCFLSLLLSTTTTAQNTITNTFVLENVRFEPANRDGLQYIILEGKGKYERMDYPRIRIFINEELVADSDHLQLYGVTLQSGHSTITNLKKVPKAFECLVVITNLHHQNGHTFSYQTKKFEASKKKETTAPKKRPQSTTKTKAAEAPCTVKEIVWMKEDNQKFLRVNFTPSEEVFGWTYPTITVAINGKVVAQRGLSAYHLTKMEFLTTDLEQLPKHFKATVTVARYHAKEKVVIQYKQ